MGRETLTIIHSIRDFLAGFVKGHDRDLQCHENTQGLEGLDQSWELENLGAEPGSGQAGADRSRGVGGVPAALQQALHFPSSCWELTLSPC